MDAEDLQSERSNNGRILQCQSSDHDHHEERLGIDKIEGGIFIQSLYRKTRVEKKTIFGLSDTEEDDEQIEILFHSPRIAHSTIESIPFVSSELMLFSLRKLFLSHIQTLKIRIRIFDLRFLRSRRFTGRCCRCTGFLTVHRMDQ